MKRANGQGTFYQRASDGLWIGAVTVDGKVRRVANRDREVAEARFKTLRLIAANGGLRESLSTQNIEGILTETLDSVAKPQPEPGKRKIGPAREERHMMIVMTKAMRGCLDCGNQDVRVLQFHHRDPSQKAVQISAIRNLWTLRAEMEKCDVLCGNCHLIRHWKMRQSKEKQSENTV